MNGFTSTLSLCKAVQRANTLAGYFFPTCIPLLLSCIFWCCQWHILPSLLRLLFACGSLFCWCQLFSFWLFLWPNNTNADRLKVLIAASCHKVIFAFALLANTFAYCCSAIFLSGTAPLTAALTNKITHRAATGKLFLAIAGYHYKTNRILYPLPIHITLLYSYNRLATPFVL